ncbi:VCBS repeat-containing protein [Nocardioides humilatus]|uniref:VCBS repeat-containing protein n=2 Tax=Nocardioides humilatus TaxID=2607660 RepID=A0A5B1LFM3_9ACTN|nr:VCBS repeat-containing protein [Nocardioides humilatus]
MGLFAIFVLILAAATTLVVVAPWQDDSDVAVGEKVPVDVPTVGQFPEGDIAPSSTPSSTPTPSTVPAEPSEPPTTTSPAPQAPAVPVTSDLDGDGLGDAVAISGVDGDLSRVLLTSTGTAFTVEREPETTYDDRTWADFDGDGRLDQVSWSYRLDGTLALTSEDLDFRELDFALGLDPRQPFVTLKAADLDGDGAVDLVAYGATDPTHVAIWALRNEGGRFTAPQQWMRIPQTTYALTMVLPGDFTGDGIADVVVRAPEALPVLRETAHLGFSLLASSGSGFVATPLERPTRFADAADVVVGDVVGDGVPRIVLLGQGPDGLEAQVLRAADGRIVRDRRHDLVVDGAGDVADSVVSDVDGDGVDDVVYVVGGRRGGFRVLDLDSARRSGRDWAAAPRCASGDCALYFQNGF